MPGISEVEYRRIDARDVALFDNVADGVFDLPLEASRLRAYLAAPGHHLIVSILGGRIVGQASAVVHHHPDKPPELAIDELAVAPDFRRRGIGRRLLGSMLELARTLGCEEAWLGTDLTNRAARALYEPRARHGDPYLMYIFSIDVP